MIPDGGRLHSCQSMSFFWDEDFALFVDGVGAVLFPGADSGEDFGG